MNNICHNIIGESVQEVWLKLLTELLLHPEHKSTPRGIPTNEITGMRLEIRNLRKNIIHHPIRNINYRFMVAEWLWITYGLNDLAVLTRYNGRMSRFSDDGKTLAGAYGPRLTGQWEYVMNTLRKDPDSRQAVATIWTPNPEPSKDVPCLGEETTVKSPEGDIILKDLALKFTLGLKRYPVYTFDPSSRDVRLTWCTNAWKSGDREALKITFDDGSFIIATEDHLVYRKVRHKLVGDGLHGSSTSVVPIPVGSLCTGDRVWSGIFLTSGGKYGRKGEFQRPLFIRNLSKNYNWKNQVAVHQEYDELLRGPLPSGWDVHHDDGNVNNNRESNLVRLSHAAHSILERKRYNAIQHETDEQKQKRVFNLLQTFTKKGHKQRKRFCETCDTFTKQEWRGERGGVHLCLVCKTVIKREKEQQRAAKKRILQLMWQDPQKRNARIVSLRSNHVVVSVEKVGIYSVYDFTVAGETHNAVVGTGVIAHNCTISFQFLRRDNLLNLIVTMRSSDAWLGIPYDCFTFSQLANSVAGELSLNTGYLVMQLGSSHLYDDNVQKAMEIKNQPNLASPFSSPLLPGWPPPAVADVLINPAANVDDLLMPPWDRYVRVLRAQSWREARNLLYQLSE